MLTLIESAYQNFLNDDDGQSVVMLNLLRFAPDGGRERYADYLAAAGPLVARYGGEIVYVGDGLPALSAESGQAWDAMALVRYPSRRAFDDMVQDPDYRDKAGPLRAASLAEAVLQPMRTVN
ncbi:DUF1330 domain-containing protein [Sphingomonas nostoxanthinifaciens]|uniref:DUF1330 domain-containing protein n=1 Tax=Sphingomonas nostoxanthinifaciens TaxID=2872652 RepID=UPI001CC1CDA3|nr:DUF1330 domain-containing protein [Sphingomonas nostoxanthinifaciens]UAK25612.1 DUF1330 domain-containing protein [Sphingomonas nostoxanthinifaciens]